MKKALWVNFTNSRNAGDRACALTRYLGILGCPPGWVHEEIDITAVNCDTARKAKASIVVIGAGGLLMPTINPFLNSLLTSPPCPVVVWGIGSNYAIGHAEPEYPDFLHGASLIALRDQGSPFPVVPCPTCLHPDFKRPKTRCNRIVVYEHHERAPIGLPFPTMKNDVTGGIREAIAFLSSSEIVVTNTYHGAYWATLLGTKVVLSESFTTRLQRTLWKYPLMEKFSDLEEKVALAAADPAALETSIASNLTFWKKVRTLFR